MKTEQLVYRNATVHYHRWGAGPKLLIAFPGYGDVAQSYAFLETALGQSHSIIAIDLPAHGQTQWPLPRFTPSDVIQLIELLLDRENALRFELIGHSFGGRIVMSVLHRFEAQVDRIFLVAPDGLQSNNLKYSPYLPSPVRRLIGLAIAYPQALLALAKGLSQYRIIPSHSYHFFQRQLQEPVQRERLQLYWRSLATFRIQLSKIRELLKGKKLPVFLFMGKNDRIIPPHLEQKLTIGLPNVQSYLMEGGHHLLGNTLGKIINEIETNQNN